MYLAYTYFVKNKITNQFYYGSRGANKTLPDTDLWNYYFTSSKEIKKLIKVYGKDSFEYKILKEADYETCYWLEQDLIKENVCNPLCLNKNYVDSLTNNHMFSMQGKTRSTESNKKLSIAHTNYRKNESKEFRSEIISRQKETWNNRSADDEKIRINKMLNSRNNNTIEELKIMAANRLAGYNNRADEEKLRSVARQKFTKSNWTDEYRQSIIDKILASPNRGGASGKTYTVTDPFNNIFVVTNLRKFCKDNNLPYDAISGIARGTQKSCKNYPGWRAAISELY